MATHRGEAPRAGDRATPSSSRQGASPDLHGSLAVLVEDPTELETIEMLATEEWQLARRIASSRRLAKSDLLPKFLLYVCEMTLRGRSHEINEQRIGTEIFNRPADYNPGEDNIVRSYARLLRKRLEEYFHEEGAHEPMRIVIPRGGYVPIFESTVQVALSQPEETANLSSPPQSDLSALSGAPSKELSNVESTTTAEASRPRYPAALLLTLGIVAGILFTAGTLWGFTSLRNAKEQSAAHPLWEQLFQSTRTTLIVPADSGLGIIENLVGHQVTVQEYANGSYLSDLKPPAGIDAGNFNDLRRQRYTSVADLDITNRLIRLPEFNPSRTEIRYAHSVTPEDLKGANVILLGSKHTNPWDELYEGLLNFRFEYSPTVDQSWIVDVRPSTGEQAVYRNGEEGTAGTYGTISYLPGTDGDGHVLMIQGLNMAATQAAAEVLFNAPLIRPVLQQATAPNGTLRPFELLIKTTSVGATAPAAQIIASRFYPQ